MRRALALGLLGAALVAGCGGDDEQEAGETTTVPAVTEIPSVTTPPPAPATATAPAPAETAPPADTSGGTTAPPRPAPQDTPENDTPPPAGSPAEKFEQFCDANPGACG